MSLLEDLTGRQFGSYRIVAPIGEGGMGAVYKAYQPSVDRFVALKILARHYSTDSEFLSRFVSEAKIVAQLQHPHILSVFDFGQSDGYSFLAMPFVSGGTLADLLKQHPVSPAMTLRIASQICGAIDYAHSKGVIHRDIKPSNILVDEGGNCLIADFGLARIAESRITRLTMTGAVLGTPAYMSPEQADGSEIGPESDIYSLGIVLYEMLAGRVPFHGPTAVAVAVKHLHDQMPPPRNFNPTLKPAIESVLLKALSRSKGDRYASGDALATALTDAVHSVQQADTIILAPRQVESHPPIAVESHPPIEVVQVPPPEVPAVAPKTGQSVWPRVVVAASLVAVVAVLLYFVALKPAAPSAPARPAAAPAAGSTPTEPGNPIQQPPPATAPSPGTIAPATAAVPASRPASPPAPGAASSGGRAARQPTSDVRQPEPASTPPRSTGDTSAPQPADCRRLLERFTLGEEMTADERARLSRCGQ